MTDRLIYLDLIRITAMLLVVACHCFGDVSQTSPKVISLLTYIEMPCIGLFMAISGALLLPVKNSTGAFIKKRLNKILIPTLIWSVVYMILRNDLTLRNLAEGIFHPVGSGILWFIYTIAGLYLISPVISPWLEKASQKVVGFYLLLWALTLCFPIISNWLNPNQTYSGWGYYLSGYMGYFILGFYLRKYGISIKVAALLYAALLCLMIFCKTQFPQFILYDGSWYLSIFGAVSVIFYWVLLKFIATKCLLKSNEYKYITLISNLIFGIYFIHIGLVNYVTPVINISGLSYLPNYIIKVLATFLIALFISRLISFLPFSDWLIGYKQKRK